MIYLPGLKCTYEPNLDDEFSWHAYNCCTSARLSAKSSFPDPLLRVIRKHGIIATSLSTFRADMKHVEPSKLLTGDMHGVSISACGMRKVSILVNRSSETNWVRRSWITDSHL